MPDWITHLGIAYLAARALHPKEKQLAIVLLAAIAPDLIKISSFLNQFLAETRFEVPLHTPMGSALFALLLSTLFTQPRRVFPLFLLGSLLHIALDSLMFPWSGAGPALLFPFSMGGYSMGSFWPDDLRPMVVTLMLIAAILIHDWKEKSETPGLNML